MSTALIVAGVLAIAGAVFAITRKKKGKAPEAPAGPAEYVSFQKDKYTLQALSGPTITLLVPQITPECQFILDYCEKAHQWWRDLTGHTHARIRIAVVDQTCGAGCGYLGAPGIEIQRPFWDRMLVAAKDGVADWIPMYELGRNYWLFKPVGEMTTGYAVFGGITVARGYTMTKARDHITWPQLDERISGLIDRYVDHGHKYADTFGAGKGIPDPDFSGGADLFASLLLRLHRDFDMTGFFRRLDRKSNDPAAAFLKAAPPAARKWLVDIIGWPA
jgi:serralysin